MVDVNHIVNNPNYVEDSLSFLKHQFQDKDNISKLHEVIASMKKELLDQAVILAEGRMIDTAVGQVLDDIGNFLGVYRGNGTDEEFRLALRVRLFRKRTHGTDFEILNALSKATGTPATEFEVYRGLFKSIDIVLFGGCVDYSTTGKELGAMFPILTSFRLIDKPATQNMFRMSSTVSPSTIAFGYGSVSFEPDVNSSYFSGLLANETLD